MSDRFEELSAQYYADEMRRLERALLASGGWRCDSCKRVFAKLERNCGETCADCERPAATETAPRPEFLF